MFAAIRGNAGSGPPWEFYAFVVAVLAFLFGDGLLRLVGNLITRRFKWEPKPFVDLAGNFKAGISHEYHNERVVTQALVARQVSLPLRLVRLVVRRERVPRRITVMRLLKGGAQQEIKSGIPETFQGPMPTTAYLPTWNVRKSRTARDLTKTRLLCVIAVGRRGVMTRRVQREHKGLIDPAALTTTEKSPPQPSPAS
jgi:hypothetical protein